MKTLALSMIVRDAAAYLPACLESVRGLVQEMVIGDTGSRDNTIAIAEQFGARVVSIPWNNNFAEARNLALAEVRSDWVLYLDADERLDTTAGECIPGLLNDKQAAAYKVKIRNYRSGGEREWDQTPKQNDSLLASAAAYPTFFERDHIRLFRRSPEIYFVGRMHESVGPRLEATGGLLLRANFCIHHFGLVLDEGTKNRKSQTYRKMGRLSLEEAPGDWHAHYELGLLELNHFHNVEEAQLLFAKACELKPDCGEAWFCLGLTYVHAGCFGEALKVLQKAEKFGHRTAFVAETRGDLHYNLGEFGEAQASYELAEKRAAGNAAVEAKLGLSMVRAGKPEQGLARLRAAIAIAPDAAELYEGLIVACVFLNRMMEAGETADEKLKFVSNLYPADYLRAASLWAQLRNWPRARRALELGLAAHPRNAEMVRAMEEIHQVRGAEIIQV